MAYPVTLNGRTYTLADFAGTNYVDGFPDALEDFVTQAGNIYTTTSASSVAIGTGSKTFTVADSGKPYIVGTPLRIADSAAPSTNWIDGIVTSYSGTTLVVDAVAYAGSGTIASWNINIGGSAIAYTGTLPIAQGGTGGTTAAAARTNIDVYSKGEADSRFLNVSGEASDVTMTGNVTIGDAGTDTLTVNATATLADATLTTADINGGTIDGVAIGSTSAATALTVAGNVSVDGGTIKLNGNYPIGANNVALGDAALDAITTGEANVAIGNAALTANTTGVSNISVGSLSMENNVGGNYNTAVGVLGLRANTSGANNTGLGYGALRSNTTASGNTAVGYRGGYSNTTGTNLTTLGYQAGYSNTTGVSNTAIGTEAALITSTGSYNTSVGVQALYSNTTASSNTAVGYQSLYANTTGAYNTAVGYKALADHTGLGNSYHTAVGGSALENTTTGVRNTAVGYQAGFSNTTGNYNTAVGMQALQASTTPNANTAVGFEAMLNNTTGANNVALGYHALRSNTTASNNTAIGLQAGYSNTTAVQSVYLGAQAGYTSTSAQNTFLGYYCGRNNTTGHANTFIGESSGNLVSTGAKNTILGRFNGNQGGLDIRTSSNNIVLSDGDGNPRVWVRSTGSTHFNNTNVNLNNGGTDGVEIGSSGYLTVSHDGGSVMNLNSRGTTPFFAQFRNQTSTIGSISTNQSSVAYNTSSDYRLKENVVELTGATERLKQIPVHRFNFIADPETTVDGFLAHEVQPIVPEAVTGEKDGMTVDDEGNTVPEFQGIDQSKLVPLLVATIKELEARITALEAK